MSYEVTNAKPELKELYVERLLWLPNKLLFEIDKRIDELTGTTPDTDLIRKPRENKYGAVYDCWHLYFRVFEIYLRSVGGGSWRAGMPPEGESAKAIFAAKKSYLFALDFWLRSVPLEQAQEECPSESETIAKTYALLKESNPTKQWLAGCLWKVLKSRESGVRSDEYDRHPEKVPSEWLRQ